jgi:hypothetical protein
MEQQITITNWSEFVNPDYVIIELSNGSRLVVKKSHAKGGKAVYRAILTLLDNMDSDARAQAMLLQLLNTIL